MSKKIRVLGVQMTPHLLLDDGENIEPLDTKPFMIRAADLDGWLALFREQLAVEEAAINDESE